MKGILVFKNIEDAHAEGFDIYEPCADYILVSKMTAAGRAFAIALRLRIGPRIL